MAEITHLHAQDHALLTIRAFEELSLNAFPALQTVFYDGWVLRFGNGYSRRANSVNPLYPVSGEVAANLRVCEQFYQQRGLPTLFKLTPAAQPAQLEESLTRQGYVLDAPTGVQTLELSALTTDSGLTHISPVLSEEWFAAHCQLGQTAPQHQATLRLMLQSLIPAAGYALLRHNGHVVACGLGVVQSGFLGLFDISTHPNFRRQGFGRQLVTSVLAWGRHTGAHTAYLQVMLNNQPALRLYAALGFKESYRYWYRRKG